MSEFEDAGNTELRGMMKWHAARARKLKAEHRDADAEWHRRERAKYRAELEARNAL